MRKFLYLDQSLESLGGHHYEYAAHFLSEIANSEISNSKFEIFVGVSRRCVEESQFPEKWNLIPIYQYDVYEGWKANEKRRNLMESLPSAKNSWKNPLRGFSAHWKKRKYLAQEQRFQQQFYRDSLALFDQVTLDSGDYVFASTVTLLEVPAIVQLLKERPELRRLNWVLQFHFPHFNGMETDYEVQRKNWLEIETSFRELTSLLPSDQLRLFSTTDQLQRQLQLLTDHPVESLPYLVNPNLRAQGEKHSTKSEPLKIGILGKLRKEKGEDSLKQLINSFDSKLFAEQKIQLVIQDALIDIPELQKYVTDDYHPVCNLPWPLPIEEYSQLIRSLDIGLLLYDARRYYSRCSGVFTELMAVGIPVVAPATGWMADQLEPAYRDYQYSLFDDSSELPFPFINTSFSEVASMENTGKETRKIACEIPEAAEAIWVEWEAVGWEVVEWERMEISHPSYIHISISQMNVEGGVISVHDQVLRVDQTQPRIPLYVSLRNHAKLLEIQLSSLSGKTLPTLKVETATLCRANHLNQNIPHGAVGLTFSDPSQVAFLLSEIVEHYSHYYKTAQKFSNSWAIKHHPKHIVQQILKPISTLHSHSQLLNSGKQISGTIT